MTRQFLVATTEVEMEVVSNEPRSSGGLIFEMPYENEVRQSVFFGQSRLADMWAQKGATRKTGEAQTLLAPHIPGQPPRMSPLGKNVACRQ